MQKRSSISWFLITVVIMLGATGSTAYADDGYTGDVWYEGGGDGGYSGDVWYDGGDTSGYTGDVWYENSGGYTGDVWYEGNTGYTGDVWYEGNNLYTNEGGYTGDVWYEGGNLYTNEGGGNLYTNEGGGNLYTNEGVYGCGYNCGYSPSYTSACGGCYYSSSASSGYGYSSGYGKSYGSPSYSAKPVTVGHGVSVGRPSGGSYGSSYSTGYPVNISSGRSVGSTYPIAKPATIGYSYNYADNSITDNSINNSFNSGSNINSPYGVAAGTSINTIPAKPHYYNTGYSYSNPSPYVALSQIPYTGFDYGPLGNAMYWAALLSVAVAGAYLLVYYNGGALSLAQNYFTRTRKSEYSAHINAMDEVNEPKEAAPEIELDDEAIKLSASDRQPATRDTMGISTDGGIPRISILRA